MVSSFHGQLIPWSARSVKEVDNVAVVSLPHRSLSPQVSVGGRDTHHFQTSLLFVQL